MRKFLNFALGSVAALTLSADAHASTFNVIYTFQGGSDGSLPNGRLVLDQSGNLYGTTIVGGLASCGWRNSGCGTAYVLAPNGLKTVLHDFGSAAGDGRFPRPLTHETNGIFYGSTSQGGTINKGTTFTLSPNGSEAVFFSFSPPYGADPSTLVSDRTGNIFGVASTFGIHKGLVFEVAPNGTATIVYEFHGGQYDGRSPNGPLIPDKAGNLYGTTFFGGGGTACGWNPPPPGCGTVFKISPGGIETVLYAFVGAADGGNPQASLAIDSTGNLYGTTLLGGAYGYGVVFKLTPGGAESVLHSFASESEGWNAGSVHLLDYTGTLYGTTFYGGGNGCSGISGCGTIFSIAPDGTYTTLHAFTGGADGAIPSSGLTSDAAGNIYGAAEEGGEAGCGGSGCGVLFKLTP